MAGAAPRGTTMPNFRTPRLLGIFNVLFATEILACGLCMGGYAVTLPLWGRVIQQAQSQTRQRFEAAKKAELVALAAREKGAKTAEERAEIAGERLRVEARPDPTAAAGMMDLNKMGMNDPALIRWTWTEVLSGLVLNAMLLASGIGLLHWKPWARSLGVWTGALKVLRLVLVYGFFIIGVVPPVSQRIGEAVSTMMAGQPGMAPPAGAGSPAAMFTRIYTVIYSAWGVGMIVLGVIYPAVLLWLLTRPGVKVACAGTHKLPKEPNQPW